METIKTAGIGGNGRPLSIADNSGPDEDIIRAPMGAPILCTIPQAAAFIARGTRFIYDAIATGQIEAVKSDKRTLIVVASLHAYVAGLPAAKIKPMRKKARRRKAA
jgi:hypothetical protein